MNYAALASDQVVEQLIPVFAERGITVHVVQNKAEALALVKQLIPQGVSVMNGSSRTLEQIGYVDYLKAGQHGWNNLHAAIVAEPDRAKQKLLRKQALLSDYYVGSVHAITETGDLLWASNTGSQIPHLAFTSDNLILVAGTQKIVPTLEDAMKRLREYIMPLEDENMQQKYGVGTMHNRTFIMHKEGPMTQRPIHLILVKEQLGF